MTAHHFALTDAEWRRIARVLPSSKTGGPPRRDDRAMVVALLEFEARPTTTEQAAKAHGLKPAALRTRLLRWRADGTLARVREAAAGALERDRRRRLRRLGFADPDEPMARLALALQR